MLNGLSDRCSDCCQVREPCIDGDHQARDHPRNRRHRWLVDEGVAHDAPAAREGDRLHRRAVLHAC